MGLYIVKGDLFEQKVDAIVVPAAPHLRLEGTLGTQLKNKCGKRLELELKQLKHPAMSESVITNAYNIHAKKIIHVTNPMWIDGKHNEENDLMFSYRSCLEMAEDFGLESIAFPILSIGAYKFPKRRAIEIAIETITEYFEDYDLNVCLVVHEESIYKTYKDLFDSCKVIGGHLSKETKQFVDEVRREQGRFAWYKENIGEILDNGPRAKAFSEKLQYFISQKGLTKEDCYLGVVSKTMFAKLLNGSVPHKYTAISLAINMGLEPEEIDELLSTIDARLDPTIDRDNIIRYSLYRGMDIFEINKALVEVGYPPLKTN